MKRTSTWLTPTTPPLPNPQHDRSSTLPTIVAEHLDATPNSGVWSSAGLSGFNRPIASIMPVTLDSKNSSPSVVVCRPRFGKRTRSPSGIDKLITAPPAQRRLPAEGTGLEPATPYGAPVLQTGRSPIRIPSEQLIQLIIYCSRPTPRPEPVAFYAPARRAARGGATARPLESAPPTGYHGRIAHHLPSTGNRPRAAMAAFWRTRLPVTTFHRQESLPTIAHP